MKVCWSLFNEIEMDIDGSVYLCCAQRVDKTSMGNIFTSNFNDIWNCELAVKMREHALKGEYPYCNHKICHKLSGNKDIHFNDIIPCFKPVMQKLPTTVAFPMGRDCNAKCIFCRDNIISSSDAEFDKIKNNLINFYLPVMKNVEVVTVNDLGDAFSSKISREIIKIISNHYPNIKFKLMTNGICASESLINQLNLKDKIMELSISINATTANTHKKIFRIDAWNLLLKNLKYIKKLHQQGKIPHFHFKFVVCSENYEEMAAFVNFAHKYGANADFWEVRDYWPNLENKYESMAVHLPSHKNFPKLKKCLRNPLFEKDFVTLSPLLIDLRKEEINSHKMKNPFFKFLH